MSTLTLKADSNYSNIPMPRKAGTCTRVPFYINTIRSEPGTPWSCTVLLDFSHVYHKSREQWVKQDHVTSVIFANVESLEKLEDVLIRAQAALLHPTQQWQDFTTCSSSAIERTNGVDFSLCQVRVVISAPDVPTLAFYDLPGLFHQAPSTKQDYLPSLVRSMVSEYISAPKAIILLVTPMNNDPENSAAAGLIRNLKAEDRTMAVLTKPDRLETGVPLDAWREILDGQAFQVKHGYYVTKQPSQQQLNQRLSRQDALDGETQFFAHQEPWSTDLIRHHARFGTDSIQEKLSALLFDAIKLNLPIMDEKINRRINDIDEQLKRIPDRLSDEEASRRVTLLLNKVGQELRYVLHGDYPRTECIIKWKSTAVDKLNTSLTMTKPQLNVVGTHNATIELSSDDDDDDDSSVPTPTKKRPAASFKKLTLSPPKKQKMSPQKMSPQKSESEASDLEPYTLTPARLNQIKLSVHADGLRDSIDPRAITEITRPAVDKWNVHVSEFLTSTYSVLIEHVHSLFEEVLIRYNTAPIATELPKEAEKLLEQMIRDVAQDAISTLTARQRTPMMVLDYERFAEAVTKETDLINSSRRKVLVKKYFDILDKQSGKKTTDKDRKIKGEKLTAADLREPFRSEIKLLATANAALTTSIAHFIDHIVIQTRYALQRCADEDSGLVARLEREWKTAAKRQALLEVDEAQALQRERLMAEKAKLVEAQRTLAAVL